MEIPSLPVSIISIVLAYKLYRRLRYNLPPGPYPWPIVGNLFSMEADRAKCYEKWSRTYGRIISVWFGSRLNVIVSDSELAKEVLKDKDQQLANRHRSQPASALTKNGQDLTWADYGPHYVKVRKICALELFSPKRIQELMPIREDEVRAMIESIYADCANPDDGNRKCLLLRKYLASVAFNNITRSVLGKRFWNERGELDEQGLEFKSIVANELKLGSSLGLTEHFWWLNWIFRFADKAFSEHLERKDRLIQAIIEEHRISDKENGGAKQLFVDALLSLREKHDISEDTMAGLLWDFIAAGMDTVAIAVEWGMAELVRNPRVQQRVQEELDLVIGRDRAMTELDILKLPYLQGVAKEVLRLHPPTPLMLPHRANSDINLGGYDIPEGTIVYVDVQAIGRNPAKWQDPLEFYPERFLKEDVDMKGHDFRLLPFGSGRRICPAAQLSINLVTSMIGHLLHHFSWTQPEGVQSEEIDMSGTPAMVNYMKTPLQAVPAMRLPPHMYKFTH